MQRKKLRLRYKIVSRKTQEKSTEDMQKKKDSATKMISNVMTYTKQLPKIIFISTATKGKQIVLQSLLWKIQQIT